MVLIGAKRLHPGEIVHTGNGPVGVGTYPEGLSQAAHRTLPRRWKRPTCRLYVTERIAQAKWNKMLINLNNATMGLTGLASQEARADA